MENLVVQKWQVEYRGFRLVCHWYPGRSLEARELEKFVQDIDAVNQRENPLAYGFFAPSVTPEWRLQFLQKTIWCLVYNNEGVPCGLSYQYDLGTHEGQRFIHGGLVKLNTHVGKDFMRVPCVPLALGNLLNFGPFFHSNITHVPVAIDMFCQGCHAIYPHFATQDTSLRQRFLPLLRRLNQEYIVPIIGYSPGALCERTFRIRGAFSEVDAGFSNRWQQVPKSPNTLCNVFVKEWLSVRETAEGDLLIQDDLALIGHCDYNFMGVPLYQECLSQMRFSPIPPLKVSPVEAENEVGIYVLPRSA